MRVPFDSGIVTENKTERNADIRFGCGLKDKYKKEVHYVQKDLFKEEKITTNYHRTKMQKEMILQKMRERGCRITKQRQMLLDVILQEDCACCKEIYYKAAAQDSGIGTATVYRMVGLLEDIGAISRKNMYKVSCCIDCEKENACMIEFDDASFCQLSAQNWYKVISEGLKACGYADGQKIVSVMVDPCANESCGCYEEIRQ